MAVTTYALEDHLTTEKPPTDPTWLCLDATVLRWLYGSMAMDIVDLVMAADATAFTVWTAVAGLFNDNQKSHEIYLAEAFRTIRQEDRSIADYLLPTKTARNARNHEFSRRRLSRVPGVTADRNPPATQKTWTIAHENGQKCPKSRVFTTPLESCTGGHGASKSSQIGRASCRERVYVLV